MTGIDPRHPRPQLRRAGWSSLDGTWSFAPDPEGRWPAPGEVEWSGSIEVPFAPETPRSGARAPRAMRACWYRRALDPVDLAPGERLLLHLGAVDHPATVWVDGAMVARHEGGYTPFSADITDGARRGRELVVRAEDDPEDMARPRGKQDWKPEPHAIWYPRTTGIWQPVWLERASATRIEALALTPDLARFEIEIAARVTGPAARRLRAVLRLGDRLLADDTWLVTGGEVVRRIALPDPGIGDARGEFLWSPSRPTLIDVELELLDPDGRACDRVESYTALRSVSTRGGRVLLNGYPIELRMVLAQGYWPESGMTAPDGDALRREVELVKELGFNGVRLHQKIEDPRFLHQADRLGLLVWEEMPAAYRFAPDALARTTREWTEVIARDRNHPCIIAWVPFNETWGLPDLADDPAQQHAARALYHLTRALDPTRLVVGNDGWQSVATDLIGIHDYEADPARLAARLTTSRAELLAAWPAGRPLLLAADGGQPIVLSEFGGVALGEAGWGYTRATSGDELAGRYEALLAAVRASPHLAGFCWTQLCDTYQEQNGLLRMDRSPKAPVERIRRA
ncbi:MAG TPA: glycoside hydrolase family 2 TIM barrel-domain containing protein, partial [Kofleriaceae bacterium]|nr:glycoside hydrolase family 2 TIM barrel-domain containing protein [Kofleriaceae bacterium]